MKRERDVGEREREIMDPLLECVFSFVGLWKPWLVNIGVNQKLLICPWEKIRFPRAAVKLFRSRLGHLRNSKAALVVYSVSS